MGHRANENDDGPLDDNHDRQGDSRPGAGGPDRPDAIRDWAPIPFEVEELEGRKLTAGSRARVRGGIAGMNMGFDIEVHAADEAGLELTAQGPIGFDVRYDLAPADGGSEVTASVSLLGDGGLTGRVAKKATEALLSAGALDGAAGRIARVAEAA